MSFFCLFFLFIFFRLEISRASDQLSLMGYIDTAQGACSFTSASLPATRADLINFSYRDQEGFFKAPLNFFGGVHKGDFFTGKKEKRDVIFIISGLFGLVRSVYSNILGGAYFRTGHNVVQLPGLYGLEFREAKPPYPHGLEDIGRKYWEIIRETVGELERRGEVIGEVRVLGASMGSFIAAMVANLDRGEDPLISEFILLSPPHKLRDSIVSLDRDIAQIIGDINLSKKGFQWMMDVFTYIDYCLLNKEKLAPSDDEGARQLKTKVLELVFVRDFYQMLKELVSSEILPLDADNFSFNDLKENYHHLNFKSLTQKVLIGYKEIFHQGDGGSLSSLLNGRGDRVKVKIVAAENDFISIGANWSLLDKQKNIEFLILPEGGHVGYWRDRDFWHFLFGCSKNFRCHEVEY